MSTRKIIENMRRAYGVEKDYELAEKMELKPGTVSGWANRGIPNDKLEQCAADTGWSIQKLLGNGENEASANMRSTIMDMFLQIQKQLTNIDNDIRSMRSDIDELKKDAGGRKNVVQSGT